MVRRLLEHPAVYNAVQRVLGSSASDRAFVAEHLRPESGDRILDLACGTGRVLGALPSTVSYLGLDVNPDYIEAARSKWGSRGEFRCVDLLDADVPANSFDLVLMMGVLHHLDDESCRAVLRMAARALVAGGRLVAIDGMYVDHQKRTARWLLGNDRGAHVRRAEEYAALARPSFGSVAIKTRNDMLRLPYPHVVLECTRV